jgi:transcriptional regulator with XRE-family HTH domain
LTVAVRTMPSALPAPQINATSRSTLLHTASPDEEMRVRGTAGASETIVNRPDAWDLYTRDTGLLDQYLDPGTLLQAQLNAVIYSGAARPPWPIVMSEWPAEAPPVDPFFFVGTGGLPVFSPLEWIRLFQPVNSDPLSLHQAARSGYADSQAAALTSIRRRFDRARAVYSQRSPRDIVVELIDELGVSQLSAARALGVTPTAVRKWRRGEATRSEHRDRLAQLAAMLHLLAEYLHDPAGWVDMPISRASTLRPLDLFMHNHPELVIFLGAGLSDPEETLDLFDPNWRASYAPDATYEVVTLSDGSRSVVPRREAGWLIGR